MPDPALQVATETLDADDGGRVALTRVTVADVAVRAPVVLVPGMFTGRRFWLSDKQVGLAGWLARRGYPAFIVQRRGLSDSPACEARAGLLEHVKFDLPAVQRAVSGAHDQPAFWIGHSFGGVMSALACARYLDRSRIRGLVLFASQFEVGKRMLDWPANVLTRGLARLLGYFPARAAGLGPENEPVAALMDATHWVATGRRDDYLCETLARIDTPVLALSGAADRVDPSSGCERFIGHFKSDDKRFVRAGRASGYSEDFDHPGIVISKTAQAEIWPQVADWLHAHCPDTRP
ncbi:alpha/beta fold hydrolase [Salinisphaera aquimarina]|uniref:Alpha/beta fold hydrolase n=1 Tax=Salinisphaera aquimarina TaxID=2094031 RepID=A0ABV7ESB1_9GAMM